jgi:hypothetical protein
LVHFSVQADHVHLLVEANDKDALSRGLRGLVIRVARAVNRVLGRMGRVWGDRYHARATKSPREVRNAIVYVLMNAQKHIPDAPTFDLCSSASSFDGWRLPSLGPPDHPRGTEPPATWLLRAGWKRHGLVSSEERPRSRL